MQHQQNNSLKEFNRLYHQLDEIYHHLALKNGWSDSAFIIFYSIMELGEGCLQKDIADRYFISRQTVNSSVRALEKAGYLYLKPGNRRDMHIYLTEHGRQLFQEKMGAVVQLENSVFESMSPEECRQLIYLTQKYVNLYQKKLNLNSSED